MGEMQKSTFDFDDSVIRIQNTENPLFQSAQPCIINVFCPSDEEGIWI
jgi:hypothetical protein